MKRQLLVTIKGSIPAKDVRDVMREVGFVFGVESVESLDTVEAQLPPGNAPSLPLTTAIIEALRDTAEAAAPERVDAYEVTSDGLKPVTFDAATLEAARRAAAQAEEEAATVSEAAPMPVDLDADLDDEPEEVEDKPSRRKSRRGRR